MGPFQFRHDLEVHAVDRGDQGRRHQHHRHHREQLDDVVLFEVDHAQHRVEHEGDLVGEIGGVIGQRRHVALHGFQLRAHLLRPFDVVGLGGDEGDEAADRNQALAHLGGEIALAADRDQDIGIALGLAGARRTFRLEDGMADRIDVGADALQNVGAAVDDRVEQFQQHGLAVDAGNGAARQLVLHQHERFRHIVTHRHQPMVRQDEGHRRDPRRFGIGRAHQTGGHVTRAVFGVEPARNLDLLHVLAGRHRDAGQPFDGVVLFGRRLDHVDPDRALRQRGKIGGSQLLQRGVGGDEHRKHEELRRTAREPTQQDLARFWQALHDRRPGICGGPMAIARRRFGETTAPAQK